MFAVDRLGVGGDHEITERLAPAAAVAVADRAEMIARYALRRTGSGFVPGSAQAPRSNTSGKIRT